MIRLVYTTFPSLDNAKQICQTLLDERIIACANFFSNMTSLYRWDNKIQNETEVAAILKTSINKKELLCSRLQTLHPYQNPCVITLSPEAVAEKYQAWLLAEVQ
jgi:periplasmic divalent cation tolerance protein